MVSKSKKKIMLIECPQCQIRMNWKEEYWGKKVRCPKCKRIFVIQKPSDEKDTPVSSKTKFSNSLVVEKEKAKVQEDKKSKLPGLDNQGDICANCGRAIAENERAYEIDGRLFCVTCEEKPSEQPTSNSQQKAGIADEIQVKCKRCQNIYSPNLKSNIAYKAWICPNCQCKNPNLKIHYRSVADVCILGLIADTLLLYAGIVQGRTGLFWILRLAHSTLLLVTFIRIYKSRAPWMDNPVKIMIVVVFGIGSVYNVGFFMLFLGLLAVPAALLYAILWSFLLWLWIQTKQCTV